jgi:hypothetical protein
MPRAKDIFPRAKNDTRRDNLHENLYRESHKPFGPLTSVT